MPRRDIIVVGASAGGVEVLQKLMAGLPPSFSASILVVLHITIHTPSRLHAILDRAGPLRATPGIDGEPLLPGRIYVASADRHLMVESDKIRLTWGPKENRMRPAVDVLFRSAAATCGPRVIGVVLGGMLDDGTAGLWAVKDRGGLAIVQSPEDTLYPSMPLNALNHVTVDHILPVAEIGPVLARLTSEPVAKEAPPISKWIEIENRIAQEGNALKAGVMELGPVSNHTCPECHGVLVKIRGGPIPRYRCHTGHSFSLQTLLADVNEAIDRGFWNAIRAIEERILLLKEMEKSSRERGDEALAEEQARQADKTEKGVQRIRKVVQATTSSDTIQEPDEQ